MAATAHKTTREAEPEMLSSPLPFDERVRGRAYELYLAREEGSGSELDDWLEAEEELRLEDAEEPAKA